MPSTDDATRRLAAFLTPLLRLPDGRLPEVTVYTFTSDDGGIRISEVDYSIKGDGGAAWMRSDYDCAGMVLACEDFLLWHDAPVEDRGDGSIYDPGQEAWMNVQYALYALFDGEVPEGVGHKWIDRTDGETYPFSTEPCSNCGGPEGNDLAQTIRAALEGDSNDAEHDALVAVAEHFAIKYTPIDYLEN